VWVFEGSYGGLEECSGPEYVIVGGNGDGGVYSIGGGYELIALVGLVDGDAQNTWVDMRADFSGEFELLGADGADDNASRVACEN
jgi:hypothetical protein